MFFELTNQFIDLSLQLYSTSETGGSQTSCGLSQHTKTFEMFNNPLKTGQLDASTSSSSFLGPTQASEPVSVRPRLLRSTGSALQQSDTETSCSVHQQDPGSKPALCRPEGPAEG